MKQEVFLYHEEADMEIIVGMIDKVLMIIEDAAIISSVKEEVKEYMQQFPLYPELG